MRSFPIKKSPSGIFTGEVPSPSSSDDDHELNERTREKFREKIKSGELDERKIEINVSSSSNPGVGVIGGGMDEVSMMNIQEMISGMMPKKPKRGKLLLVKPESYYWKKRQLNL